MRLRELRKLVEQLTVGGALTIEALSEQVIDEIIPSDGVSELGNGWLELGPIHLDARTYLVTWNAQAIGDSIAGDVLVLNPLIIEDGVQSSLSGGSIVVQDAWPTSSSQGPGQLMSQQVVFCMVPTELYLLVAVANAAQDGPPSSPVTARNIRLSAVPI